MLRRKIIRLIKKVTGQKNVHLEKPENAAYGDYSTNIALKLKENAQEIAKKLNLSLFKKVEVAKPGFINFFISEKYLQKQVREILKKGEKFGELQIGKNQKVNIEFISANPTGPLTLGNGRGGFWGDCLANVLAKAGFKVSREYYINDRGSQIEKLGHSILGDNLAVYKGKYIDELRKRLKPTLINNSAQRVGQEAAKIILQEMIKPAVKQMGIKFDAWVSEKKLHEKKEVERILNLLKDKKLTYKKDNALWFKSSQFGDDKDRVLIKEDGQETYFLSDIAYLQNKFKRGFKKLFFLWGADHYGYINRVKAAAKALGYPQDNVIILTMQLVHLFEKGRELKISKRSGIYFTIEELIDEVGLDVARFFFLARSIESHLNFDLDLAKEQSEKNPVYYVQYGYARICSILRKAKIKKDYKYRKYTLVKLLVHQYELNLIKQLVRFPEIIEDTAKDYQLQRIPQYAVDLARDFHRFYKHCRVISGDKNLTRARLDLVLATKIVLGNTLRLMGISTPERM